MSKYTTEVRWIMEMIALENNPSLTPADVSGFDKLPTVLADANLDSLFNFQYPIFDEDYKHGLERKIISHYYDREIGFETVGQWKLHLSNKLNEIMPYYNQMYKSELIKYNPLYNINLSTTSSKNNSSEEQTEQNDSVSNTGRKTFDNHDFSSGKIDKDRAETLKENTANTQTGDKYNGVSDTPQGGVQGIMLGAGDAQYLSRADYGNTTQLTNNNRNESFSRNDDTEYRDDKKTKYNESVGGTQIGNKQLSKNGLTTEQYIDKVVGQNISKSSASLIKEFRETFLRLDSQVIEELEPLFFQLW